ncbi:MAG: hypothetical protein A2534_04570 [Candidatus Magasanikbacteria bacterium RIFOXYD2_FULL_39_9]|uniref:Uncharacterized protein n=1 Tax=Candidatus Magasanikbacteria bacterium RIFOXYD1_FULL_40_23 TaxID=1798705 RepID=A0A1F6PB27_9BACT|nr:MAG: hypothetical protein A2534_04570 [Candidatus Magasanikbacteria bacterium RIFOXYD2_FULL_39_9]OGH93328.1 MAG: hypothetical protein A2563_01835 [Candidatus Magasanikbacteria bacterium RIFOXYD1_FULL_40_23]
MAQRQGCRCLEAYILGERLNNSPHDCDYVDARNKLQVEAGKRATAICGSASQDARWIREFHKAMNDLAYETELVKWPPRPEGLEFAIPVKLKQVKLKKFGN